MPDLENVCGVWPNVAVEAGTDTREAMRRHGVEPGELRTACYEHEKQIDALEDLIRDMIPYLIDEVGVEGLKRRAMELLEVDE